MSRIHWPSLILTLIALALALWIILHMPAGAEGLCAANGGEWFDDLERCL